MRAIILGLIFSGQLLAGGADNYIEQVDQRIYRPEKAGLQDLVVDIEIPQLTEQLNKQRSYGTVTRLYYRLYWTLDPMRLQGEVKGISPGFTGLRDNLTTIFKDKINFIFPLLLKEKIKTFAMEAKSLKPLILVGINKDNLAEVLSTEYQISTDWEIEKVVSQKGVGVIIDEMESEKKSWSKGKWAPVKSTTKFVEGALSAQITTEITYDEINKVGLPVAVKTISEQEVKVSPSEKQKGETREDVIFSNYQVNEGKARTWYLKKK